MTTAIYPEFLQPSALKLVFFGGKGGVGKSTCATATALQLAHEQPHHQFLLASTDPAHSLRAILADLALPENLQVCELDAAASLHEFKTHYDAVLKEIAERGTFLDQKDIQDLMDAAMPGMDELAAYFEIAEWIQQDKYYRVIIDTAPTGHTLRLLEMPELIRRWLVALDTLLAKHRYMRQHFAHNYQQDHLDDFLLRMNDSVKAMHSIMVDKHRCQFVLVMLAENMSVEESVDLAKALALQKVSLPELVVNRLYPENNCPNCGVERNRQLHALENAIKHLPKPVFWGLPLLALEPRGNLILNMWSNGRTLNKNTVTASCNVQPLFSYRGSAVPLPNSHLRLLIFAGKGGVGKTTLACATALRLHNDYPNLRILLFSTDPAHSLSDCLSVKIQTYPTLVLSAVDAQEIDAEAHFEKIRLSFRAELENFLQDALPHLDITFDREVMEHLLDLAPPGLDEIMALTAIINHFESHRYDMIIVDAAPSGHLLRLLELPGLIREWPKQFFSLLLKYRQVMRLPQLSKRLVQLSQDLKKLRVLLQDSEQTGLYAVAIPTQLAIEKTVEMTDALQPLDVSVKALFINQITPDNDCDFCQAIASREVLAIKHAQSLFPQLPQAKIFRQTEPSGLNELMALGSAIFSQGTSGAACL